MLSSSFSHILSIGYDIVFFSRSINMAKVLKGNLSLAFFCILSFGLISCAWAKLSPKDGAFFQDVRFAEKPFIVKRGENYYFHYRMNIDEYHRQYHRLPSRQILGTKKTKDKAYYFFSRVSVSSPEFGNVKESPLAFDGFIEFAKKNAVFYLNPDGTEIQLEIVEE